MTEDYRRGPARRRGSRQGYLLARAEWEAAQAAAKQCREADESNAHSVDSGAVKRGPDALAGDRPSDLSAEHESEGG